MQNDIEDPERVELGKYKGKLWSEVPRSYLEFTGNLDTNGPLPKLCREELALRHGKLTEIRILPSGYDSASFCCLDLWQEAIDSQETTKGFHSFMLGFAKHAYETGTEISLDYHSEFKNDQVVVGKRFMEKIFTFIEGKIYPVLKHVRTSK